MRFARGLIFLCKNFLIRLYSSAKIFSTDVSLAYYNKLVKSKAMTIQERILELLDKKHWTKYKLAKEAGFYPTTVYDWFNEKNFTPDRNSIELICAALDISLTEFYSGIDEGELDGEQMLLLELFAKVPKKKRNIVFDLLRNLSE